MLPGGDGFTVLSEIRRLKPKLPVIILTARGREADRVRGLRLGADDYVVKPFGLRELVARIRAVSRRASGRPGPRNVLRSDGLEVDLGARRVTVDGREVQLTVKEFDLLALLAADPGVVVDRKRILREVWDTTWYGSSKTVDVHVASLRKKLGDPTLVEDLHAPAPSCPGALLARHRRRPLPATRPMARPLRNPLPAAPEGAPGR